MTTPTTETITFRPPTLDDLEAVAQLVAACDEAITGESMIEDERISIRNDWENDSHTNLQTDAWLAAAESGQVVGYEITFELNQPAMHADGYVHPEYIGQGIGTALLRRAEARVREAAGAIAEGEPVVLRAGVYSSEDRAREMFLNEGFALTRHFWQMRITMDAPPAAPELPDGIVIRPFVPGRDERDAYETVEGAFRDHWGHNEHSYEEWVQFMTGREDFDPSLWFLAYAGEEPVGAVLGYPRGDIGWVRALAVSRPWRRHGLGMALLRHSFGVFYARGDRTVGLGVDAQSLTGATRLYERAGMSVYHRFDTFEKQIRA